MRRFGKDSGEIATRINMRDRTGIAAMAMQIVMQVATRTRALRKKTLHNVDDRAGLSAIVDNIVEICSRSICISSETCAVRRVRTSEPNQP